MSAAIQTTSLSRKIRILRVPTWCKVTFWPLMVILNKQLSLTGKLRLYIYTRNTARMLPVLVICTLKALKLPARAKNSYYYRCFSQLQIQEFGINHPGTTQMLKCCQQQT